MKKITILALHLGYGGIEKCISTLSNSLIDNYEIEKSQKYFNLYVYIDGTLNNGINENSTIDLTLGVEANSEKNEITKKITSEVDDVTSEATSHTEEE